MERICKGHRTWQLVLLNLPATVLQTPLQRGKCPVTEDAGIPQIIPHDKIRLATCIR
jgi:hypothetical protein